MLTEWHYKKGRAAAVLLKASAESSGVRREDEKMCIQAIVYHV